MNLQAWFRDAPIKHKLLSIGLLTQALALLFVSLTLAAKDILEWRAHAVSELTSYALVIGQNAAPAMLFDDHQAASVTLATLSTKPDIVRAVIYDTNGNVFADYKNSIHKDDVLPSIEPGNYWLSFDRLSIVKHIHFKNDTLGSLYLESDLHGLYIQILHGVGLIFLAASGAFLLAALMFARLQKIIVSPILNMAEVMQTCTTEQNFSVRANPEGKDEISMLARTFNTMLERIQLRESELEGHRKLLEEKVAQRTAELREANLLLEDELTERKRAETDLRIAATAFESQESLMITDADGVILRVNKAFTMSTGYTAEEILGQTPRILKSGRHNDEFYIAMWETINTTGVWQGEIWDRRKNGEIHPKLLTISAVKSDEGTITHYVGAHIDITERKAAEERILQLAFFDTLTGLPNRRLLMDRLLQAVASAERTGHAGALLFLDLDNFKSLNDTLGHDMGDLLLQQAAKRLETCVRKTDTVARLGGDEFVVILTRLSKQLIEAAAQTESVGEKIIEALGQPYFLGSNERYSTASIGAVLFLNRDQPLDELMKHADIAMYQAKKSGRNTLRFFDPKMQASITARVLLESELRKALEKNQFQLYYQIQVDSSSRPLGAEVLLRWAHPEKGIVSPAEFIPLAEETGLIVPIGLWVLQTACVQLKQWQNGALTRDLTLAVNVSAKQFRQVDFATQVQRVLLESGARPSHLKLEGGDVNRSRLKLELTESIVLDNVEETISKMREIKALGVGFSMDDFGTGYSSLQYLKRLPLDQLKIDQSFVRDISFDNSDKAIVRTIIAMAESLEIGVIAEGVETEAQRSFLLENGCSNFQGYLFGRPMPIDEFESLLKRSLAKVM